MTDSASTLTKQDRQKLCEMAEHFDDKLTTLLNVQQVIMDVLEDCISRMDGVLSAADEVKDVKALLERAMRLSVIAPSDESRH